MQEDEITLKGETLAIALFKAYPALHNHYRMIKDVVVSTDFDYDYGYDSEIGDIYWVDNEVTD